MKRSLFIAFAPEILASVALLRFLFIKWFIYQSTLPSDPGNRK